MPIAYGLPGPGLFEAEERGEVVTGGCVIWDDNPTRACTSCAHRWGRKEDDEAEDLEPG